MVKNKDKGIKPKVIGLFSGCGGLDLWFHLAGFDVVYANDFASAVKATYEANIGPIEIKDIRQIDKNSLPDADVVLAWIPCQPFSNAWDRKGMGDERWTLFTEVVEILHIKKPKVVIFENVRWFLSAHDDKGVKMPERVSVDLKKAWYTLHYKLLNASDHWVPQNRHRVFMVGIRNDIEKWFTFPEVISDKKHLTVWKVLSKPLPKEEVEVWDLSPQSIHIIEHIPAGGSWKNVPDDVLPERMLKIRKNMKHYHSPNFYRRFNLDEIMGTVTAAATPENSGILHPLENRRYSVREIARFQSFPDSFKFVWATVSQKYKMIGNAVPVLLWKAVADELFKQYFSEPSGCAPENKTTKKSNNKK